MTTEFKVEDGDKLILLIIDPQNDFHPEGMDSYTIIDFHPQDPVYTKEVVGEGTKIQRKKGSLAVPGANEDSARIAALIKKGVNGRPFDQIIVTLDTHNVNHIAHSSFWKAVNSGDTYSTILAGEKKTVKGEGPEWGICIILSTDVGVKWVPKDESLTAYCKSYCKKLEDGENKYTLKIWNHHCLQGTPGHAVVKVIADELINWSKTNGKTVDYRQKGQNNLTEMYSVIKAEVPLKSDPKTQTNTDLLNALLNPAYDYKNGTGIFHSDSIRGGVEQGVGSQFSFSTPTTFTNTKVFICGEALDYCVYSSTKDIIAYMKKTGDMITKMPNLILLQNCTSHIADPNKLDEFKPDITFATVSDDGITIKVTNTPTAQQPKSYTRSIVGNSVADFGNRMFNKIRTGGRVSRRRHPKREGKRRSSRR